MNRRAIAVIVAGLLVAALVIAYRLSPPTQAACAAAERLKAARTVNFGGGGYAGRISEAEDDLFAILSSHHAEELLSGVFKSGSPEAKTYALCGLHYVAPKRFEHYASTFATQKIKVQTLSGCLGGESDSASLVAALRTNVFEQYLPIRKEIENNRHKLEKQHKKSVETNRRPASPLDAGRQFGSAPCAPPFVPAAVARLWRWLAGL